MDDARWDVPLSEKGIQALLGRLEESRAAGDELAVGYGLLALGCHIERVRYAQDTSSFVRSYVTEALAIFRRFGEARGQARALREAASFLEGEERARTLAEADRLAVASEDEIPVARSLAAQAHTIGFSNRPTAARLSREAIPIFLRHGLKVSAARTLFRLATYADDPQERYEAAAESARLYREANEPGDAGLAAGLAFVYGKALLPMVDLESLALQELAGARADRNRRLEVSAYSHLVEVAEAKGDAEGSARYLRWRDEVKASEGLPL